MSDLLRTASPIRLRLLSAAIALLCTLVPLSGRAQTDTVPADTSREPLPRIDERAFQYFVQAMFFEQVGELHAAAENYKRALQYYPNSADIRWSYAEVLYQQEEFDDAVKVLQLVDDPDAPILELLANTYRANGDIRRAVETYHRLVEVDDFNASAYSFLGTYYRQVRNIDSTIWAYEKLAHMMPGNYRLWTELAKLQAQNGGIEAAKESFRQSINAGRNKDNMLAFIGLVDLYLYEEKVDSAMLVMKQGLDVDPNEIVLNRYLVNQYIVNDSFSMALPYARKLANLQPLDRAAWRRLATLYYFTDSLNMADSIFSELVRTGDVNPANHNFLAQIAIREENYNRAAKEFAQVTQLADSVADGWLGLGFALSQLDKRDLQIEAYQRGLNHMTDEESAVKLLFAMGAAYEQSDKDSLAVETFEELIDNRPDHAQALNYLGYMLAEKGERLDYAEKLIARALEQDPDNAAYLDSYGWVKYQQGDYGQAIEFLERAATLGSDAVIYDHLGDAYQADGDADKARQWWEKALTLDPDNITIREKLED